jgi:hypothetical protein
MRVFGSGVELLTDLDVLTLLDPPLPTGAL